MAIDKNTVAIGIDHGWSQMKTTNTEVFTTGVKEITTQPALFDNVIEYDGKYYKVGGDRLEVKETKVLDNNFYLLTLAAMAKELEYRCKRNAHVLLEVGLAQFILESGYGKSELVQGANNCFGMKNHFQGIHGAVLLGMV